MRNVEDTIVLQTDQYKANGHADMLPDYVQSVSAYLEGRKGAKHNILVWNGLQAILKKDFVGEVITQEGIDFSETILGLSNFHENHFNKASWERMLKKHNGRLPISIKALPEGECVPIENALLGIEGTDDEFPWLSQRLESRLMHVWYPTTIATKSRVNLEVIKKYMRESSDLPEDVAKHLYIDFGYRGTSGNEQSAIGAAAHLLNAYGSDTIQGLIQIHKYYGGLGTTIGKYAYGVPASEHSISQTYGRTGERQYLMDMILRYPQWLVSIVGDTYNIEDFVNVHVRGCKQMIIDRYNARLGDLSKAIIRPDSLRGPDDTPLAQVLWIYDVLADIFGFEYNSKSKKVLYPGIGILWGDGLTDQEIDDLYAGVSGAGWSVESCAVGQGGGLLVKDANRDTERFAIKPSSQKRGGIWVPVQKDPLDKSKRSKAGLLKVVKMQDKSARGWSYKTITEDYPLFHDFKDERIEIFRNGELLVDYDFDSMRVRADNF